MLASSARRLAAHQQGVLLGRRLMASSAWSNSLSFASPEADFSGCDASASKDRLFFSSQAAATNQHHQEGFHASLQESSWWSNSISYASPESDFTGPNTFQSSETLASTQQEQQDFYFSSSYTVTAPQEWWSNTISFASPEADFTSPEVARHCIQKNRYPESLAEALRSNLACVVTRPTAPHTIVTVNAAWTELCGYTAAEVMGKSLGMLQGSMTNTQLAASTVEQANAKKWVDMYLVNYKKNGSPFTNHLSLKEVPLNDDEPNVRFLLGVLEPVHRAPLRMIM
jgi:PAS domain S-box-containing protein